jgi:ABC-2 type transport system permease protein
MKVIASLDPLSYGVDGLRAALIGGAVFGTYLDLTVLCCLCTVLFVLGSWLFSRIEL